LLLLLLLLLTMLPPGALPVIAALFSSRLAALSFTVANSDAIASCMLLTASGSS
jgi:hypothetical protein